MSEPTPKNPWPFPIKCPACQQFHDAAESCPAFAKPETQDDRDRRRADEQEKEELDRYDSQPHHGKPARKPPKP